MATLMMDMNTAEGQVVRIEGYRGDDRVVYGEVVAIRDIFMKPIKARTHREDVMTRGRYMLTLRLSDNTYKAFYIGHIEKLEVMTPTQRVLLRLRRTFS